MPKKQKPQEHPLSTPIKLIGCIVTQGGRPCTLINLTGGHKGGILLPGSPVVSFLKHRDARRAIERTERVRDSLQGSLIDTWDRVQALFAGGAFEIKSLGHQEAPKLTALVEVKP